MITKEQAKLMWVNGECGNMCYVKGGKKKHVKPYYRQNQRW